VEVVISYVFSYLTLEVVVSSVFSYLTLEVIVSSVFSYLTLEVVISSVFSYLREDNTKLKNLCLIPLSLFKQQNMLKFKLKLPLTSNN
jgi:hypothetical protein